MCRYMIHAAHRRFYEADTKLVISLICLYLYLSILIMELLDITFGMYCQQSIFGLSLLFPNLNFPLLLYLFHFTILCVHRKMPIIVYEVNKEDCFIQLERHRCLHLKDCRLLSKAIRLPHLPSKTTTKLRRNFEGRIVQVQDMKELESLLPCLIREKKQKSTA
ncbi:hypothetical protein WR25_02591 [Diploscapter pachys]|uniref:Uncharacterized protein n=1 Tax=Diploscapter pachys TaxID=2018661 RepID=A0A2A2LAA2_9BILA|nr:hypothetical protein WR25_02591 [Diploscapter pachys]